jgi:hypothetical protein
MKLLNSSCSESMKPLLSCNVLQPILPRNPSCHQICRDRRHPIGCFVSDVEDRFSFAPLLTRHHPHTFEIASDGMEVLSLKNEIPEIEWRPGLYGMQCEGFAGGD